MTAENPNEPIETVALATFIEQGAASRAGGFTQVDCGPLGVLPSGTCEFDFTLGAIGTGTLVPGDATARFELNLYEPGFVGALIGTLDEVQIPATLVAP
jgi:hypothetical protein